MFKHLRGAALGGILAAMWVSISAAPNFILFHADDQDYRAVRELGNPALITPTLDSLARAGTAFTRAYNMGANTGAVCVPSRAMMLSGRGLYRLQGTGGTIPRAHRTFPEILQAAGYETFMTGKWHNDTASLARSFTSGAEIMTGGMDDHWNFQTRSYSRDQGFHGTADRKGKHASEVFADAAIRFLAGRKAGKPFLLYLPFMSPHDPRKAPEAWSGLYAASGLDLPRNFQAAHGFDNGELEVRDELLSPRPRTAAAIRSQLAAYYSEISHLDSQVARVLAALRQTGQAESTVVVFSSDHGVALGQHGLLGKQNLYEHSTRIPFLFSGPGVPRGERRDALVHLHDLHATVIARAGLVPGAPESRNLLPIIQAGSASGRASLYLGYREFQRSLVEGRYKLIEYNVGGIRTTQLFDLEADPWEGTNLAGDPAAAVLLERLRTGLKAAAVQAGDDGAFWTGFDKPSRPAPSIDLLPTSSARRPAGPGARKHARSFGSWRDVLGRLTGFR